MERSNPLSTLQNGSFRKGTLRFLLLLLLLFFIIIIIIIIIMNFYSAETIKNIQKRFTII